MTVLELPQSSRLFIAVTVLSAACASFLVLRFQNFSILMLIVLFFLSGFFADMLTAFFHFGFDYVFPYSMPILGPIAREFRAHHEYPTLDPSNYVVNLTKGAYASFPLSLIAMLTTWLGGDGLAVFLLSGTMTGMSIWALFFHQIHAYAHMGSHLHPERFNARVAEIAQLADPREQVRQFDQLFDTLPIPKAIRVLQRWRILLNPATHNLHHIRFESDFSSVNGWSDPLTNPLFGMIARSYKQKQMSRD